MFVLCIIENITLTKSSKEFDVHSAYPELTRKLPDNGDPYLDTND